MPNGGVYIGAGNTRLICGATIAAYFRYYWTTRRVIAIASRYYSYRPDCPNWVTRRWVFADRMHCFPAMCARYRKVVNQCGVRILPPQLGSYPHYIFVRASFAFCMTNVHDPKTDFELFCGYRDVARDRERWSTLKIELRIEQKNNSSVSSLLL